MVTRLEALPLKALVMSAVIPVEGIFGTEISRDVKPLYLPGTVFVVVSLVSFFLHRMDRAAYGRAWKKSVQTMIMASVALVFTVPMVQVFIYSDGGTSEYAKMPIALAAGVEQLTGLLMDESPNVRRAAAESLRQFAKKAIVAVPNLVTACEKETDPSARVVMLQALSSLHKDEGNLIEILTNAFADDQESVRLKTVTWNGAVEVITLKLDNQYWPAYEIRRTENGWQRSSFGS